MPGYISEAGLADLSGKIRNFAAEFVRFGKSLDKFADDVLLMALEQEHSAEAHGYPVIITGTRLTQKEVVYVRILDSKDKKGGEA